MARRRGRPCNPPFFDFTVARFPDLSFPVSAIRYRMVRGLSGLDRDIVQLNLGPSHCLVV